MMFIYKTAKFAPVWITILKIWAIFVCQILTEHALCGVLKYAHMINSSVASLYTTIFFFSSLHDCKYFG